MRDASSVRSNHIHATRRFAWGFVALMAALFVIAAVALVVIAREQNARQAEHSVADVARAFKSNGRLLNIALADYAFWDDAYRYAGQRSVDLDWAFERDNMGPSLFSNYSLEGVFILDTTLNTRYAVVDGKLSDISAARYINADLAALASLARKRAVDDQTAHGYYLIQGRPAQVYAAAIKPSEMDDPKALAKTWVLVYVDILDLPRMATDEFAVQGLEAHIGQAHPETATSLRVKGDLDTQLELGWTAERPGDAFIRPLLPALGLILAVFGLLMGVLQRRMLRSAVAFDAGQAALLRSEERFRSITEASSDWIWETDGKGLLTYLSERFSVMTGFSREQWLGRPLCDLLQVSWEQFCRAAGHEADAALPAKRQLECSYADSKGRLRDCVLSVRALGHPTGASGFCGTVNDVTQEVEAKRRIKHMSQHDALTGLANRAYLYTHLQTLLADRREPLYLLSLDLDRFKPINDTLGHPTGDRVLCEIANRLRLCVRDRDLVARLGGDEFVVVVEHLPAGYSVENLCARIRDALGQPIMQGEHELTVGVSMGVVVAPRDGTHPGDLLRYADIALYEAKAAGKNNWQFYASEMNERVLERRQVETDLRNALRRSELVLEFQPRYAVNGQTLSGAEALVRWNHPGRGRLPPAQFIGVAEETGLIVPLSDWVLHTACQAALGWGGELVVSVNLSPVEFQRGDLVARIHRVLQQTGLPAARLELEITETVLLEDSAAALTIMHNLKQLGVRLALDDFGTGYSSLSYLRTYPFDGLKIDRSFIADLHGERRGTGLAIVESIIGLGRALTMTVTAEGVETDSQLSDLVQVDCDEAQGYLLGRPLPMADFQALAEQGQPTPA